LGGKSREKQLRKFPGYFLDGQLLRRRRTVEGMEPSSELQLLLIWTKNYVLWELWIIVFPGLCCIFFADSLCIGCS